MEKALNKFTGEEALENTLKNLLSEEERREFWEAIKKLCTKEINLLIVGGTGVGKSSTINALFETRGGGKVSEVGTSSKPQTMEIQKYELDTLKIWDSPGLGDGDEQDRHHAEKIIELLQKKDEQGNALIDLVLVILDGSSRDLGTSYRLINEVIIPNLSEEDRKRVLIAMNKIDLVNPREFDYTENKPSDKLMQRLDENALIIQERIKRDTSVDVDVIYYCSGAEDEDGKQPPYNLSKLLFYISDHTPEEKRLVYAAHQNESEQNFRDSDERRNYNADTEEGFFKTLVKFGGKVVVKVLENIPVVGTVVKVFKAGWDWLKSWW